MRIQEEVVQLNISIEDTEAAQVVLHKKELDAIRAKERFELNQLYVEHERRMAVANAAYQSKLKDFFESIKRRQALQEHRLRISKELEEQLAKQEQLRLEESKMLEEEEARRLLELEEALRKARLENSQLERRLKENREKKDLAWRTPLIIKRREALVASYPELATAYENSKLKQTFTIYSQLKDPGWCMWPEDSKESEAGIAWSSFLGAFCFRCLKSFAPLEIIHST